MSGHFTKPAGLVTNRPRVALAVLAIATVVLFYGSTLLLPQAGNDAFLPADSEVAQAGETLAEAFPNSAGLTSVTVLHRGDFLTLDGLAQIDAVVAAALN